MGCSRFSHDRVGEANTKLPLEAKQQLHPLEAADAQVAIEGILERGLARGPSAQLVDQTPYDLEYLVVHGGVVGIRDSHELGHQGANRPGFLEEIDAVDRRVTASAAHPGFAVRDVSAGGVASLTIMDCQRVNVHTSQKSERIRMNSPVFRPVV
jgi:hypothetical protein